LACGPRWCASSGSTASPKLLEVLRHRFITLLSMFATIALTGYLFVVIPKGFFPQQDTGLIGSPRKALTPCGAYEAGLKIVCERVSV
jgi:hypothetical protein